MSKKKKSRAQKAGLPPGSLVYVGDHSASPTRFQLLRYDAASLDERELGSADLVTPSTSSGVTWYNIDGLDQIENISAIGARFKIHPLILEDILNTTQRPKRVISMEHVFIVLKMLYLSDEGRVLSEQVSLVFGSNFLLSFQEEVGRDVFDRVREGIRKGAPQIRNQGPDYLAYALIDTIVDHYFVVLESLGERLEALEHLVMDQPGEDVLQDIYKIKRELLSLRRSAWPLRELVGNLERGEVPFIRPSTQVYLRDVYEHLIEVIEVTEMYRDMAQSLIEIYLSSVNNRINQVMKVLAMVATVFMPLTLISSIYGMNFEHMPELRWEYGYPLTLAFMAVITVCMIVLFKRKRWI